MSKITLILLLTFLSLSGLAQPRFLIGGGVSYGHIPKWNGFQTWADSQNTALNLQGNDKIALPTGYSLSGWFLQSQSLLRHHFVLGANVGANKGFAFTLPQQNGSLMYKTRFRHAQAEVGLHASLWRFLFVGTYSPGIYGTIVDSVYKETSGNVLAEKRLAKVSLRHNVAAQVSISILQNIGLSLRYDYHLGKFLPSNKPKPLGPLPDLHYPMGNVTATLYLRFRYRDMEE